MEEKMCEITKAINTMIDDKDPIQRLIGLTATLIDSKFKKVEENLNNIESKIEKHSKHCPLNLDIRVKKIENSIKIIEFMAENPKIFLLSMLGLSSLLGLGINEIISLFLK